MDDDGAAGRAEAFAWADRQRRAREALRDDLSSGRRTLSAVLSARADGDDARTKVLFVLESLPGASKVRTRRRLAELGIDGLTPLRDLADGTCAVIEGSFPLEATPGSDRSAS